MPGRAWHYLDSRLGVEHGTTLDRLGMRGFAGYEPNWQSREENYTVRQPYVRLLDPLLDQVCDRIRFGAAVERIEWGGPQALVRLASGEDLRADAVIYTGSVAVLRDAPPEFFPYGIYSVPEMSTIGMTEEQVRAKSIPYECGVARFRETSRGHIMGLNSGMMKLLFSLKTRRLLGAHIIGEGATELIHIGQAVLNLKGTLDYFIENTFNYPTLAEAYKIAALDAWNRMPKLAG